MIRKAVSTVSLLWLATMFSSGLAFITQIILARQLGVVEFGSFSAALATVNLLTPLAGFGVNGFWLNIFGKEGWDALRWVKPSLLFSSFSTFAVIILIIAWAMLGAHDEQSAFLLIVLSGCVISQAVVEIVSSCFQLEENYFYLSIWQFLQHGLRLASVAVIIFLCSKLTAISVSFIYAAVAVLVMAFGVFPLKRMIRCDILLKGHARKFISQKFGELAMVEVFRQSWPFGLAGVFHLIYFQSDIVLLSYLSDSKQVGFYNVAFVVMSAVYLFPSVVYQKYLLPKIQRWANHDVVTLRMVYLKGNFIMFIAGLLSATAIILTAPFIIPVLFGSIYSSSVVLLSILAFAIPFRFVATSIGAMLATRDNMRKKSSYMGLVALFNFSLNLFFIPYYGMFGAAITTLASEVLLLIVYWIAVQKMIFINLTTR